VVHHWEPYAEQDGSMAPAFIDTAANFKNGQGRGADGRAYVGAKAFALMGRGQLAMQPVANFHPDYMSTRQLRKSRDKSADSPHGYASRRVLDLANAWPLVPE